MITQQKLTFIFQKLRHFYENKSHAVSQPTATRFVKINMISVALLSAAQFKSCYTCVQNSILILIFFHAAALQFHQEHLQYLLRGILRFLQPDMKVNCDKSFLISSIKQACNYNCHWSAL